MAYPAIGVLVIGISLGALLYYMFGTGNRNYEEYASFNYNNSPPYDPYDSRNSQLKTKDNGKRKRFWRSNSDTNCPICLKKIVDDKCILDPCNHEFHKECIESWKTKGVQGAKKFCPICRKEYKILVL